MDLLGYFGASFLFVWGIYYLIEKKNFSSLTDVELAKKKKRIILVSLILSVILGIVLLILRGLATTYSS